MKVLLVGDTRRARHHLRPRRGPPLHNRVGGPESLRLRDGDTTVVDEYAKHGRLVDAGSVEQAEQAAARAWLADTLAGRGTLLVVGTNAAAAGVSTQLRAELVRLGRVHEAGSGSACPAGRARSPGSGTSRKPAARPGTSTDSRCRGCLSTVRAPHRALPSTATGTAFLSAPAMRPRADGAAAALVAPCPRIPRRCY